MALPGIPKSTLPLRDTRDLWARVGLRFAWCTLPYFLVAQGIAASGDDRFLRSPMTFWMMAVPVAGGLIDWWRLERRRKCAMSHPSARN